ncbi:hypothetical protein [Aurantiacibacter sp. MUD61]|uniref:hypothetical protein n=1 Tax=Aurantiacibacter sp. MUD61 TaxID=3009083 RepID=UPI0022F11136|nr:hypothetical protein [Aurantiacibacter sp. MUD61]
MRKLILSAALAGTALTLAACSQETAEVEPVDETVETAEPADTSADASGVVDANTATADDLAGIAQIDEELAAAIVAGQPYANAMDFNAVLMQSLTEEQAAAVREVLFVPVNLNDTSSEELALIPGIDERMIREFEEYAPYDDMAEFDREIGKYVDEEEVARFRQYVTL